LLHAAAKATEAAAPEATEASTAASRCIAGTPTHGCEPARDASDGGVREELAAGGVLRSGGGPLSGANR